MNISFIETLEFTNCVYDYVSDDAYADLQKLLMENPELGKVVPGCGGVRKIRIADSRRSKGKRGGARVLYMNVLEADWICFLDIYGKNESEDLTAADRKMFRTIAAAIRRQAVAMSSKEKEKNK